MKIRFWGVRGSIPTPLSNKELISKIEGAVRMAVKAGLKSEDQTREFIRKLPKDILLTSGGNTACIEINAGEHLIIMDAGSGIRSLGADLLTKSGGKPINGHIFLTHTHWDHIMGIPFFVPAFNPANSFTFYSPNPDLEKLVRGQQTPEYFPVPLAPAFKFREMPEKSAIDINGISIDNIRLNHPGGSYGYRLTHNGKSVVYATDSEYKDLTSDALKPYIDFFQNADILIYDAQYTMLENFEKEDWGHSNMFTGIDLALEAGVKKLIFTHHEPTYDDRTLWEILGKAKEYLEINRSERELKVYLAYEGAEVTL